MKTTTKQDILGLIGIALFAAVIGYFTEGTARKPRLFRAGRNGGVASANLSA